MNQIEIFNSPEFGSIRVIEENGKYLFCGADVAKSLGYKDREGMRSLARNKSLKYTSGMIKFSLLQSFSEYYNGEMEKGYVRQALLDLSEMVLYYEG